MRHAVIVTAAGSSSRFNNAFDSQDAFGSQGAVDSQDAVEFQDKSGSATVVKKEFVKLQDEPVLVRSIRPFLSVEGLVAVVVTYKKEFFDETIDCLKQLNISNDIDSFLVRGGATRQESVFNALQLLHEEGEDIDLVSIHDGARPFVTKELIEDCLNTASKVGGACPALPVSDTLVKVQDGLIVSRLERSGIYGVQTPQTFRFQDIYEAHLVAKENANNGPIYTDDTQIFTDCGFQVAIVKGDPKNIKITYPSDLEKL